MPSAAPCAGPQPAVVHAALVLRSLQGPPSPILSLLPARPVHFILSLHVSLIQEAEAVQLAIVENGVPCACTVSANNANHFAGSRASCTMVMSWLVVERADLQVMHMSRMSLA